MEQVNGVSYPKTGKRGVPQQFPRRLYNMLESESEQQQLSPRDSRLIAWSESGKAFRIEDVTLFSTLILPKYFRTNKFSSFQRNLNLVSTLSETIWSNRRLRVVLAATGLPFLHQNSILGYKDTLSGLFSILIVYMHHSPVVTVPNKSSLTHTNFLSIAIVTVWLFEGSPWTRCRHVRTSIVFKRAYWNSLWAQEM